MRSTRILSTNLHGTIKTSWSRCSLPSRLSASSSRKILKLYKSGCPKKSSTSPAYKSISSTNQAHLFPSLCSRKDLGIYRLRGFCILKRQQRWWLCILSQLLARVQAIWCLVKTQMGTNFSDRCLSIWKLRMTPWLTNCLMRKSGSETTAWSKIWIQFWPRSMLQFRNCANLKRDCSWLSTGWLSSSDSDTRSTLIPTIMR